MLAAAAGSILKDACPCGWLPSEPLGIGGEGSWMFFECHTREPMLMLLH